MMNDQSYFHWDFFRPPLHSPSIQMGAPFLDIRDDGMRGLQNKNKAFSLDQSCALWSKDMGLDPGDGFQHVGGRVLEIRKEKSRDAARSRRGKENYEFYELAKLLPLPAAITSQLDKASIIRLSISYLKLRDFCGHGDPPWNRDNGITNKSMKGNQRRRNTAASTIDLFEIHQGAHILQTARFDPAEQTKRKGQQTYHPGVIGITEPLSLDGFAFTLSADGRFLYISETVSIYLGLSQVEMAGSSIFDYVHAQDHQELADQLGLGLASVTSSLSSPSSPSVDSPNSSRAITPPLSDRVPVMAPNIDKGHERTFCLRMKSTLTKRGAHTRSSGYRVVFISGRFRYQVNYGLTRKSSPPLLGLVGVAIALPPPTITELRIEADTFIMRLTSEFKIIYCENMISTLTDWRCDDLCGKDLYEFCHPGDVTALKKVHSDLLVKGQVFSPSLRLLNKGGGYIWIVLCATSLYSSKTSEDPTFLAIFQTISSIEHRGVVMDASHLKSHSNGIKPFSRDQTQDICGENVFSSEKDISTVCHSKGKDFLRSEGGHILGSPESNTCDSAEPIRENDFLIDESIVEETTRFDNKISRRKMEYPRKRRRESETRVSLEDVIDSDNEVTACVELAENVTDADDSILNLSSSTANRALNGSSEGVNSKRAKHVTSPVLPEDLSCRSLSQKDDLNCCDRNTEDSNVLGSSVRELEKVMDRHLPQKSSTFGVCDSETLTKEAHEQQKSAIQWTGSCSNSATVSSSEPLSASAFLRHLYSSRESVIRSNGRPYSYSDMTALNMLTPPGSDLCKDQLHLNIPHISTQNKQFHNNKESVSLINSTNDEFNMTPPSSVSPQEKMTSPFHEVDLTTNECLRMRSNHNVSHFLSVPNYHCPTPDLGSFSHEPASSGSILYEARSSSNSGSWFPSAYHS